MSKEVLQELKENREKGAALLMETYAGLLWSVCAKRLQNEEDIKECVNGVFAEFCLNPDRYDESKGSLKNYLCEIADRRAIDMYRKNLRNQKVEEAVFAKRKAEKEELEKQQEEAEVLAKALEQLEPIDSQILRMKYYDGMTYEEIAKSLGMTRESVKKRGLRGRKKLLYIILVGLIIAVLAACAAVIMRKYQFSPWRGFLWSEEAAYELVEGEYVTEAEDVKVTLADALYCDGILEVEMYLEWLDPERFDNNGLAHRMKAFYNEEFVMYDENHQRLSSNTTYDMLVSSIVNDGRIRRILLTYHPKNIERDKEMLLFQVVIDENVVWDIELRKLPMIEIEESTNGVEMPDGSKLIFGKGYIGDDGIGILNLYQKGAKEYAISEQLTSSFMGTHGKKSAVIYLKDELGKEYPILRCMWEDVQQAGIRREYNLYFPGIVEGEYTLHIPRLCVQKKMVSERIVLELPVETDTLTLDKEVIFPDGTGFCITGIRREYYESILKNYSFDDEFEGEEIFPFQRYYLEYEPLEKDNLEYLVAMAKGDGVSCGVNQEDKFFLEVAGARLPEQLEVTFENPYYMMEESYEVNIEVEKLAQ